MKENTISSQDSDPLTGRQIARAAIIVMAAFVLSRLLGLAREVILAQIFGASAEFEAYLAALQLPDTLFFVVAGGALGSAFIPTFSAALSKGNRQSAWRLASAVLNLILLLLIVLGALAWLFAQWIVANLLAPGFLPEQQILAAQLMRIMLVTPIIFAASGIVMGTLNSHQRFVGPAFAPSMYNLGIIGGALLLSDSMGVRGLAWGTVAGATLHLLAQVPGLLRVGARYFPVLTLRDEGVREVARLMGPRVLGLAVVQLNFWVNIFLASSMVLGSVAALKRGFAVMLLPQGVIAQSIATVVFPTFAALAARGETVGLRRTLSQTLSAVMFMALPATVGLVILRRPIVRLIFERGAFTPTDTAATAWALLFYGLGLASHSLVEIVTRAFYALHDTLTPVIIGGGAMLLNVVLSLLLINVIGNSDSLPIGPFGGLALANTIATTLEGLGLLWIIRRKLDGLHEGRLLNSLARAGLASLGMGAGLLGLLTLLDGSSSLLIIGLGVSLSALLYWALALLLGSDEARLFTDYATKRLRR